MTDEKVYVGILTEDVRVSMPWEKIRIVPAGECVKLNPASNLPEDSWIKWWAYPMSEDSPWLEYAEGPYGVGLGWNDVTNVEEFI